MEIKPLISVIVPIYNVKLYLEQCIDSIVNQTYTNLEIILVDDGSTDGSGTICDEYALADSRIKIIHKKNEGLVSARKAGIQNATGDYVTYVDGDDWLDKDAYESLLDSLDVKRPDIICYGMQENYADNIVICKNKIPCGYYSGIKMEHEIYPYMLCNGQFYEFGVIPNIWAKLIKRDILLSCQMEVNNQVTIGEDTVCTMAVFLNAKSCIFSDKTPYHYRKRMDSMTENMMGEREIKILFQNMKEVLGKSGKEFLFTQLYKYMFWILLLKKCEVFFEQPLKDLAFGNTENKRLVLYGAGGFGREVFRKMQEKSCGKIVLWVDKAYATYQAEGLPVSPVEELKIQECDVVWITILNTKVCEEIKQNLVELGIPQEKIRYIIYSEKCEAAMKKMLQEM